MSLFPRPIIGVSVPSSVLSAWDVGIVCVLICVLICIPGLALIILRVVTLNIAACRALVILRDLTLNIAAGRALVISLDLTLNIAACRVLRLVAL